MQELMAGLLRAMGYRTTSNVMSRLTCHAVANEP